MIQFDLHIFQMGWKKPPTSRHFWEDGSSSPGGWTPQLGCSLHWVKFAFSIGSEYNMQVVQYSTMFLTKKQWFEWAAFSCIFQLMCCFLPVSCSTVLHTQRALSWRRAPMADSVIFWVSMIFPWIICCHPNWTAHQHDTWQNQSIYPPQRFSINKGSIRDCFLGPSLLHIATPFFPAGGGWVDLPVDGGVRVLWNHIQVRYWTCGSTPWTKAPG